MKNTSKETPAVQNCGSRYVTATHTITITKEDAEHYHWVLSDINFERFYDFFRYQPTAISILSKFALANTTPSYVRNEVAKFVDSLACINQYLYSINDYSSTISELIKLMTVEEGNE